MFSYVFVADLAVCLSCSCNLFHIIIPLVIHLRCLCLLNFISIIVKINVLLISSFNPHVIARMWLFIAGILVIYFRYGIPS